MTNNSNLTRDNPLIMPAQKSTSMIILRKNKQLKNRIVNRFGDDDAVRFSGDGVRMTDVAILGGAYQKAHWDAVQYVPPSKRGKPNLQYAAALLRNTIAKRVTVVADGTLQGFFGGDGFFEKIAITDCMINTSSAHEIAFNGLLSGTFLRNSNGEGKAKKKPSRVVLDNGRIGGGENGGVWVLSMKGDKYQKAQVSDKAYLTDYRGKAWRKSGKYITDLDLTLFRYYALKIKFKEVHQYCNELQNLALELGRLEE